MTADNDVTTRSLLVQNKKIIFGFTSSSRWATFWSFHEFGAEKHVRTSLLFFKFFCFCMYQNRYSHVGNMTKTARNQVLVDEIVAQDPQLLALARTQLTV